MDSTRQNKISRLVQREMSEIFQREVREVVKGTMVSVTSVKVTPDLAIAKMYLSIFPSEHKTDVFNSIKAANTQIRYLLGQRVGKQLRVIPELQFFIDDSLDYLENIDRLLKE